MRRHYHRAIATIVVLLVVAACGGTAAPSPSPSPSPDEEIRAALEATIEEGTVRVDQTVEFAGSSLIPEGTAGSASGQAAFDESRQMRLDGDFTGMGLGEIELVQDGSLVYAHGAFFTDLGLIGPDEWLLVDLESSDPAVAPFKSMTSGENDLSMSLFYLYGVTGDVEVTDGETINGVATRHFAVDIDLEAARESIPDSHTEALEDLLAGLRVSGIERELAGEVWIGEDGLVHQVAYTYTLGPEMGEGTMSTVITFTDFGAPMELGLPDPDDVVPIEDVAP